jgi:hypothetical protein
MKSYKSYSESAYLRKEDFPEPKVATIVEAREEQVTAPGKKPKDKIVLYFREPDKGLVTNMAHGDALFDMTGSDDPEDWVGETVELYHDPSVAYAGKRVGGIRLRPVRKLAAKTKPQRPVKTSEPSSDDIDGVNAELASAPY